MSHVEFKKWQCPLSLFSSFLTNSMPNHCRIYEISYRLVVFLLYKTIIILYSMSIFRNDRVEMYDLRVKSLII